MSSYLERHPSCVVFWPNSMVIIFKVLPLLSSPSETLLGMKHKDGLCWGFPLSGLACFSPPGKSWWISALILLYTRTLVAECRMLIHDRSYRWILSIDGDVIGQSVRINSVDFFCARMLVLGKRFTWLHYWIYSRVLISKRPKQSCN